MNEKKADSRRVKMTKFLLMDSLIQLLGTKDLHRISVREICEKADVNRSTFYKHYGSQYDLLHEMEDDFIAKAEKALTRLAQERVPTFSDLLQLLLDNIELSTLLISSNVDPDFLQRIVSLPIVMYLFDMHLAKTVGKTAEHYAKEFYVSGACSIMRTWLKNPERESVEQMSNIMVGIIVRDN